MFRELSEVGVEDAVRQPLAFLSHLLSTQDCSLLMHPMYEYLMDEEGPKFCEQSHMLLGSNNAVSRQTV